MRKLYTLAKIIEKKYNYFYKQAADLEDIEDLQDLNAEEQDSVKKEVVETANHVNALESDLKKDLPEGVAFTDFKDYVVRIRHDYANYKNCFLAANEEDFKAKFFNNINKDLNGKSLLQSFLDFYNDNEILKKLPLQETATFIIDDLSNLESNITFQTACQSLARNLDNSLLDLIGKIKSEENIATSPLIVNLYNKVGKNNIAYYLFYLFFSSSDTCKKFWNKRILSINGQLTDTGKKYYAMRAVYLRAKKKYPEDVKIKIREISNRYGKRSNEQVSHIIDIKSKNLKDIKEQLNKQNLSKEDRLDLELQKIKLLAEISLSTSLQRGKKFKDPLKVGKIRNDLKKLLESDSNSPDVVSKISKLTSELENEYLKKHKRPESNETRLIKRSVENIRGFILTSPQEIVKSTVLHPAYIKQHQLKKSEEVRAFFSPMFESCRKQIESSKEQLKEHLINIIDAAKEEEKKKYNQGLAEIYIAIQEKRLVKGNLISELNKLRDETTKERLVGEVLKITCDKINADKKLQLSAKGSGKAKAQREAHKTHGKTMLSRERSKLESDENALTRAESIVARKEITGIDEEAVHILSSYIYTKLEQNGSEVANIKEFLRSFGEFLYWTDLVYSAFTENGVSTGGRSSGDLNILKTRKDTVMKMVSNENFLTGFLSTLEKFKLNLGQYKADCDNIIYYYNEAKEALSSEEAFQEFNSNILNNFSSDEEDLEEIL